MLSETNKLQRNAIFFIVVETLHVSGGFPAHHQEPQNCTCSICYLSGLIAATASVVEMELHLHLQLHLQLAPFKYNINTL
jgi:hypothetical protein